MSFQIYANQQELMHLPEDGEWLYHNLPWARHPAYDHCMVLDLKEDAQEAMAIYHELWHYRYHLPMLKRSWS